MKGLDKLFDLYTKMTAAAASVKTTASAAMGKREGAKL